MSMRSRTTPLLDGLQIHKILKHIASWSWVYLNQLYAPLLGQDLFIHVLLECLHAGNYHSGREGNIITPHAIDV